MSAAIFSMQALKDNIAELAVQPGKKIIGVLYPEDIVDDDETFLELVKENSPRKKSPEKKEKPKLERKLTKA